MSNARSIAEALGGAKQHGDWWNCKCPLHDDAKSDSLGIIDRADGSVWFECLAGCDGLDIKKHVQALGLLENNFVRNGDNKPKRPTYTYIYTDENGEYLYEKFKFWNEKTNKKDMRCRRKQPHGEYIWDIKGVQRVLYNLPNVLRAVRDKQIIYIVEGEKDADTLNKLGLIATTSITTGQWPHEFSKLLAGAKVVIIPDNDAAGEKGRKVRVASLSKEGVELKVLTLPSEVKDVTEWFELGKTLEDFKLLIEETEEVEGKSKKKKEASRESYYKIIKDFFGELKRDIFSDDLCYQDKFSKLWVPAANKIKPLRSQVRQEALTASIKLRAAEVEDHLYYLEDETKPTFLIDIPGWDGRDRLAELSQRITLKKDAKHPGVNIRCFEEMLKYWHCKTWLRLVDPTIRNEIFILAGAQNLGKDFWIRENLDGLGQFLVNFSIHTNERDTKEQLHRGLVMNISEFDRTSRSEVSLLKEVVTATQTDLRFAYDRRAVTRSCRCSFIASTNVNDIFNDPTGHSRYVFFEIENIDKSSQFRPEDKIQVLAQGLALAVSNYKPSATSLAAMRGLISDLTPEDEYELIVERWDYLATQYFQTLGIVDQNDYAAMRGDPQIFSGFIPNNLVSDILVSLAREFGKSTKKIRQTLKGFGRADNIYGVGRGYYFRMAIPDHPSQNLQI